MIFFNKFLSFLGFRNSDSGGIINSTLAQPCELDRDNTGQFGLLLQACTATKFIRSYDKIAFPIEISKPAAWLLLDQRRGPQRRSYTAAKPRFPGFDDD